MLRTIILERIDSLGLENFKSFSKVKEFYDKPRNEILKVIRNFEIIVIKSTIKVDEEFLKHSKKIKVVARAGTGLDNINQKLLKNKLTDQQKISAPSKPNKPLPPIPRKEI